MIAATIGGQITIANIISLIMSLKNNNSVCCQIKNKLITTFKLLKPSYQSKLKLHTLLEPWRALMTKVKYRENGK